METKQNFVSSLKYSNKMLLYLIIEFSSSDFLLMHVENPVDIVYSPADGAFYVVGADSEVAMYDVFNFSYSGGSSVYPGLASSRGVKLG